MTCSELVAYVYDLGARISLKNDRVRVSAPRGALSEEIWRELSARKDELRQWLEGLYEGEVARPALQAQARPEHLPLSYAQQRLWLIDQLEDGASTEYNMPEALRLVGPLDAAALQRALNTIVAPPQKPAPP